ncbi:MAG: M55 family metallopeptidase [Candidatus Bathyarchaeota archaeon]|nr:MAG: M55 family metallopeptidase [Candidatus Bathyarchaeota archaeon]
MKIHVSCDMEGTAGVVNQELQCLLKGEYYKQARRLATLELNALAEGALEAGATRIIAWNGHCEFPGGLDPELIHTEVELNMGSGEGGPVHLDGSYDALLQVGLHAMDHTPGAIVAHGLWTLNGLRLGEIGMTSQIAGMHGVSCVFVSGDRAVAAEAETLIPNITTVAVKEALFSDFRGKDEAPILTVSPERARSLIKEKAIEALSRIDEVRPFKIEPPYVLQCHFRDKSHGDWILDSHPDARWVDETALEVSREDFWDLPI